MTDSCSHAFADCVDVVNSLLLLQLLSGAVTEDDRYDGALCMNASVLYTLHGHKAHETLPVFWAKQVTCQTGVCTPHTCICHFRDHIACPTHA